MIFIKDAVLLARTKLRLRIVRLSLTILTSSLLFALLFFVVLVVTGSTNSALSFGQEGFGGRYIVSATPYTFALNFPEDQALIKEVQATHTAMVAERKAAAKKLNLSYDANQDLTLPLSEYNTPSGSVKTLNFGSPVVLALIAQKNAQQQALTYASFSESAKNSGAVQTFKSASPFNFYAQYSTDTQNKISVIVAGKEKAATQNNQFGPPKGIDTIGVLGWRQFDDELLKPFLLTGQTLALGSDGSAPVVAPFSAAEEILGLKPLADTASAKEKLARLEKVRTDIVGNKTQICYRNSASQQLFDTATAQIQEIASNKSNKNYIAPPLQYALSDTPCAAVLIKKDVRTAEEKQAADNEKKFKQQFGNYVEPEQFMVSVRIVGLTTDFDFGNALSVSQILQSVLRSSLGTGWYTPASVVSTNPQIAKAMQTKPIAELAPAELQYFAEFNSLAETKQFIDKNKCDNSPEMNFGGPPVNGFSECTKKGVWFGVATFGNNAGAIEEFKQGFWNFAKYAGFITVLFAALIMMGNLGKIIADSRRETAVFRALGAKRLDIAQIYITYTLLIAGLVTLAAFTIGLAGAMFIDARYSQDVSVQAVLAFNSADITKSFALFGFEPKYILGIVGLIFAAALISTLGPLVSNLRRNPIKDMRDEGA